MAATWQECVLDGLHRYSIRNRTSKIERGPFLAQELASMSAAVGSIWLRRDFVSGKAHCGA
jgi:hypothetical protein